MSFGEIMTVIETVILFLGLAATIWTLRRTHNENKAMSTIELIIHQRSDDALNDAINLTTKLARDLRDFSDLSDYLKNVQSKEYQAIIKVLNFREFVAVGINNDVIDEQIYKDAYYSTILRDWNYLKTTVNFIRNSKTGYPTAFQDFEKLAQRWEKKPLKRKVK